jgi:Domain of unknown function (DUF4397)
MNSPKHLSVVAMAATLFLPPSLASAQDAYIYFGHGIAGHDLNAATNPDLPVDIAVITGGGTPTCLVQGAPSGSFTGPFTVGPGTYTVDISNANTSAPCSKPAAISGTFTVAANESTALIMGLTTTDTPTGLVVPLDLTPVPSGSARVIFVNASSAQPLNLEMATSDGTPYTVPNVPTGGFQAAIVPSGVINAEVASGSAVLLGPGQTALPDSSVLLAVSVGSVTTKSFTTVGRYFLSVHP